MPNESVAVWAAGPNAPPERHRPKYRIRTMIAKDMVSSTFHVETARLGLGGLFGWAFDSNWRDRADAVARIKALSAAGQVTMFNSDGQELV